MKQCLLINVCLDRKRVAPSTADRDDEPGEKRIIKAKPVPHYGVPVILPNCSKKTTTMEPFSFHERDAMAQEKKDTKIKAILEMEKTEREFKAKPMPNLDRPVGIPPSEPLKPTQAEPFDLW